MQMVVGKLTCKTCILPVVQTSGHVAFWKLCLRCFDSIQAKQSQNKEGQSGESLWNVYCSASVHTIGFIIYAVSIEPAGSATYNRGFVVKKICFFFPPLPARTFLLVILAALKLFSPTLLWVGEAQCRIKLFPWH